MFKSGEKYRILNSDAEVTVRDAAGADVTANGDIAANAASLNIAGFCDLVIGDITNVKMRRAVARTAEVSTYAVVAPAGVSIGDVIEVSILAKTSRYQSELKNNFIGAARPVIFATAPLTGVTTTNIADAITAAFTAYTSLFNMGQEFIASVANTGANVTITLAGGYESVNVDRVEITRANQGLAIQPALTLAQTIGTANNEGSGLGKYLEESVSMATMGNVDPFGVDNEDTRVDLRGLYTEVAFSTAKRSFVLFLNEATIASDSGVHLLAELVVLLATTLATVSVNAITTPTVTQEDVEGLLIATGASVAASADFIA